MINRFFHSFTYAFRGISYVIRHEVNFRVQLVIAVVVMLCGWGVGLRRSEWAVILWLIFLVLILELLNSALEKFVDILRPRLSGHVEIVKDIMAGMVLLATIAAVLIGGIIFYPYLVELFFEI